MADETNLLDLPVELLLSIVSCLDLNTFLNLTSTCKALHEPDFVYDSTYWSALLRTTFRVPNQPVIQHGGDRWYKLFKRMHSQSTVYTWGDNGKYALGHTPNIPAQPGMTRTEALRRRHISWPERMVRVEDLGVISDLQCGGWSTTLLTSKGALYTVGVLDALHPLAREQRVKYEPAPLRYPPGFPHPYDRYDSSTAIRQFSSGRAHILGLSDSGRIWSWQNIEHAALHVKFVLYDTVENGKAAGRGTVKHVAAGWNKSGALVEGTGIVIWEPLHRAEDDNELEDAALVLQSVVVPRSSFVEPRHAASDRVRRSNNPGTELIGEVRNFIVLEDIVVFNTQLGKVFVSEVVWDRRGEMAGVPVELILPVEENDEAAFATDVQGSFQSFGVFTRSGAVLTCKQDRVIDLIHGQLGDTPLFTTIKALQHKDVIQLAFGDHHFHALHSPGYITSYGHEPQACGALGLGGHGTPDGRIRGIRYQGAGGDGRLIPHAYTEGRRVWFEREKRAWIDFLTSGGKSPDGEAQERIRMALGTPGIQCQGEVSEWVEQQGRDWEEKFGVKSLGAYFALSVTAGGWHSGALVLENTELVEKLRRACELPDPAAQDSDQSENSTANGLADVLSQGSYIEGAPWFLNAAIATGADWGRWALGMAPYDAGSLAQAAQSYTGGTHPINYGAAPRVGFIYKWANDHFPRLRLSDGTEMPGSVPFDEWRYERPVWDVDFTL